MKGLFVDDGWLRRGHRAEHVLNIDDTDHRPSLATALSTSEFYGLDGAKARNVVSEVVDVVVDWRDVARDAGIANADIEVTAGAFSAPAGYVAELR